MVKFTERARQKTPLSIEYLDLPGEKIPLPDGNVDTVVSTFTLGTISGIGAAMQGIRRVLKPNGKLIFCEVGRWPDPLVQRWQERWQPITRRIFLGLDLTRNIAGFIEHAGFQMENLGTTYFDESSPALKAWTYCSWRVATVK